MSRTRGSVDIGRRSKRSDKGKPRKFYKGKSVKRKRKKKGKFVPYISKRQRRGTVKIWWWIEEPMSQEGYRRISPETRRYMRKVVYRPLLRANVEPYMLSTIENIKQLALHNLGYEGTFLLKMFSHAKTKTHCTNRTVAKVIIKDSDDGLRVSVEETWRIKKYWFFRGN